MDHKAAITDDFNRIAKLCHIGWDHNRFYHKFLLKNVPAGAEKALDIGCGTGEFTRLLAGHAGHVTGVDLSPDMIKKAKESTAGLPDIMYEAADISEFDLMDDEYDCIVSIAALHHMHIGEILKRVKSSLRSGGVLLILDLYRQTSIADHILSISALMPNLLMMFIKTGRFGKTKEERDAWNEHDRHDKFPSFSEMRLLAADVLPGVRLKRHLFWRYSLIWKKH